MENEEERSLAARLYNASWTLLEQAQRSEDEDVALLTNAFTSRFHWSEVGGPQQLIISEWMVSRAAAATGWAELAVFFALRANRAAQEPGTADWLIASTAEGVARAYGALGDTKQRDEWCQRAERLVAAISDDEDRAIIAGQLASVLG